MRLSYLRTMTFTCDALQCEHLLVMQHFWISAASRIIFKKTVDLKYIKTSSWILVLFWFLLHMTNPKNGNRFLRNSICYTI